MNNLINIFIENLMKLKVMSKRKDFNLIKNRCFRSFLWRWQSI